MISVHIIIIIKIFISCVQRQKFEIFSSRKQNHRQPSKQTDHESLDHQVAPVQKNRFSSFKFGMLEKISFDDDDDDDDNDIDDNVDDFDQALTSSKSQTNKVSPSSRKINSVKHKVPTPPNTIIENDIDLNSENKSEVQSVKTLIRKIEEITVSPQTKQVKSSKNTKNEHQTTSPTKMEEYFMFSPKYLDKSPKSSKSPKFNFFNNLSISNDPSPIKDFLNGLNQQHQDLTWNSVQSQLSETLAQTQNLAFASKNEIFYKPTNDGLSKFQNTNTNVSQTNSIDLSKFNVLERNGLFHQIPWNFKSITNIVMLNVSKEIYKQEKTFLQSKNQIVNAETNQVVKSSLTQQTQTQNDSDSINRNNKKYHKIVRDFVSENTWEHLYADAKLYKMNKLQKHKIVSTSRPRSARSPQSSKSPNCKASKTTSIIRTSQTYKILNNQLNRSLSQVYKKLVKSSCRLIKKGEFVDHCFEFFSEKFHIDADYWIDTCLPLLFDIMKTYDSFVHTLQITTNASDNHCNIYKSTFVEHAKILISKSHFTSAAQKYINQLESISTNQININQS